MIRSVELELKTVSEANAREFWRARAERRAGQRAAVRKVLDEDFGRAKPALDLVEKLASGQTVARLGQLTVELTRIAPGELDADENLPMSFKAIKDEIADWLGLRTDRDKRVRWSFRQERSARGVYKIRIEIRDVAPGADIRVQRATSAEHEAGALLPTHPKAKPPRPQSGQGALAFTCSFAALPWEQTPCPDCSGRGGDLGGGQPCCTCYGNGLSRACVLTPLSRFAGLDDPPRSIEWRVPVAHLARYGRDTVTLHRRTFRSKATGRCWLYETTSPHPAALHENDTKEI